LKTLQSKPAQPDNTKPRKTKTMKRVKEKSKDNKNNMGWPLEEDEISVLTDEELNERKRDMVKNGQTLDKLAY
jgi:hypothetical protein